MTAMTRETSNHDDAIKRIAELTREWEAGELDDDGAGELAELQSLTEDAACATTTKKSEMNTETLNSLVRTVAAEMASNAINSGDQMEFLLTAGWDMEQIAAWEPYCNHDADADEQTMTVCECGAVYVESDWVEVR